MGVNIPNRSVLLVLGDAQKRASALAHTHITGTTPLRTWPSSSISSSDFLPFTQLRMELGDPSTIHTLGCGYASCPECGNTTRASEQHGGYQVTLPSSR